MSSLYLEPADLINLIAKNKMLKQDQIHFHITYYKGISTLHKKSESNLALAACSLLNNKPEETKLFLRNYLQNQIPGLSYYYQLLNGLLYEKMELHQKAVEVYILAYNEIHEKIKKKYLLFQRLIDCYSITKNYLEADDFFLKVSDIPKKIQTYIYAKLGYFCEILSMDEKAIEWYSKISNLDDSVSRACYVWLSYLQGRDISELLDFYRSIEPRNDPALFDWDYLKSLYFISKNDLDKALEIIKKISDEIKKDEYFSLLGYLYLKKKNIIQAFVSYLKALQKDSEKAENWYNLAVIYKKVDQIECEATLVKARSLDRNLKFSEDLTSSSDVVIIKFDFSLFGKEPVLKTKKNKLKKQKIAEQETANEVSAEIVSPAVSNNNSALPNFGITAMPDMSLFYDTMMKMWNPYILQSSPLGVMPSFNFFVSPPGGQNGELRNSELPKKRNKRSKKSS